MANAPPIKIIKQRVTAQPRKLSARWTIEPIENISWRAPSQWELFTSPYSVETLSGERTYGECYRRKVKYWSKYTDSAVEPEYEYATIFDVLAGRHELGHGLDIEKEIEDAMAAELTAEIDKEILDDLIKAASVIKEEKWIEEAIIKAKEIELIPSLILPNKDWIERSG